MEQEKMETDSSQGPDADAVPFNTSTQPTLPPVVPSPGQQDVVELMTRKSDMYYSMAHKNRGKAILINMHKFKKRNERIGAPKDMEAMRAAFTHLQFRIVVLENKSRRDLMSDLKREAEDENLKYDDCLAVVIMTHGCEGYLSASDLLFQLEDVKDIFMPKNCKELAGKPKLFFVQACRGKGMEEAVKALDAKSKDKKKQLYLIPVTCDILEFHSTNEGKIAARDPELGSWFIQSLATELLANGFEKSVLNILSLVIRKVAIDCEYEEEGEVWKQQPVIISTLSRILKFDRKNQ